jgi:co-chaperonin GroES (HSP10)
MKAVYDMKIGDDPDLRTEEEVFPEVDHGLTVVGDRILLQLRRQKAMSKGGIVLVSETTDTLKYNEVVCKVRQIGPLAYRNLDTLELWPEGQWVNIDDLVRSVKWGGDRVVIDPNDGGAPVIFITVNQREVISKIASFEHAQRQKAFID